jgi:hypothetical protein
MAKPFLKLAIAAALGIASLLPVLTASAQNFVTIGTGGITGVTQPRSGAGRGAL